MNNNNIHNRSSYDKVNYDTSSVKELKKESTSKLATVSAKPTFKKMDLQMATFKGVVKYEFSWIPFVLKMPFASLGVDKFLGLNKLKNEQENVDKKGIKCSPTIAEVVSISIVCACASLGIGLILLPFTPIFAIFSCINAAVSATTGKDIHDRAIVVVIKDQDTETGSTHSNQSHKVIIKKAYNEEIGIRDGVLLKDLLDTSDQKLNQVVANKESMMEFLQEKGHINAKSDHPDLPTDDINDDRREDSHEQKLS